MNTQENGETMSSTKKQVWLKEDELFPVYYQVSDFPDDKYDRLVELDISFLARWEAAHKEFTEVQKELKKVFKQ